MHVGTSIGIDILDNEQSLVGRARALMRCRGRLIDSVIGLVATTNPCSALLVGEDPSMADKVRSPPPIFSIPRFIISVYSNNVANCIRIALYLSNELYSLPKSSLLKPISLIESLFPCSDLPRALLHLVLATLSDADKGIDL